MSDMLGTWFVVVPKGEEKSFRKMYAGQVGFTLAESEAARLCVKEKTEAWVCHVVGCVKPKEAPVEWSRVGDLG